MTATITNLTLPSGIQGSAIAITGSIAFNGTTQFLTTTTSGVDGTNLTPLGGSIAFNGTSTSYVSYATDSSLDLATGAGNWTVECWFYVIAYPTGQYVWGPLLQKGWNDGGNNPSYGFLLNSNGSLYYFLSGSNQSTPAVSLRTWYHAAMVRQGNVIGYYLNGVLFSSLALTFTMSDAGGDLFLNSATNGFSRGFNGYVNNARVVKGQAVYPCTFTPPTTALTAVTGTSLLLDVASSGAYLTDSSTNNYTVTNTGSVTYSSSTPVSSGGSLSFNGTSNYISTNGAALPTGTSDFTLEFWTYQSSFSYGSFPRLVQGNVTGALQIYMSGSGLYVGGDGAFTFCSYNISSYAGTWLHIAVTRTNGRVYLWLNGIAVSVASDSTLTYSLAAATTLKIFQPEASGPAGLMTNFRIVKNTAIYNVNFTPSTLPLPSTQSANIYGNPSTAITGTQTSLLLNAPVGGSFLTDSSSFNHTPTNGGTATSSSFTNFNSYPFTVEFWWKPSGSGQANGKIFQTTDGDGYTGVSLTLDGTGNNLLVYMSSTGQSWNLVNGTSFTLTTGTWYHLALVYDSTNIKLYVNGTGTTLATVTTYINPVGTTVIGGQTNGKNAYGLISNVRVMNGVAAYTSNFTPPSGPLSITQSSNQNGNPSNATPTIVSTNLMLNTVNDSSYLTDSSYYKNTITANASPTSSATNPFTTPTSIQYLVVAGGGGGGQGNGGGGTGGGGGAGGLVEGTASVTSGYTIAVTVGLGGAPSNSGSNSSLTLPASVVALGGGRGGNTGQTGNTGGSGGGGGGNPSSGGQAGASALQPSSASGGYGNSGGNGGDYVGGGGGGAGAVGGNTSGNGGNGREWPTGSGTYYAGGGAGPIGAGGLGGGGSNGVSGPNGVANTGGGGAGGPGGTGGSGGSGVVIIRYPAGYSAVPSTTGSPTITITGGYIYYTFNNSGTITF